MKLGSKIRRCEIFGGLTVIKIQLSRNRDSKGPQLVFKKYDNIEDVLA